MTLDEAIEYEEETADEEALQILDWLRVLKNIQSTGDCNICEKRGHCEYEPNPGQMLRYNCPFYKKEGANKMTCGVIYWEFCKKFPNVEVSDFSPAYPQYLPCLVKPIPNAIVVWLKDGSKMVYIAEEAKDE